MSGRQNGDLAFMFGYPATKHCDCEIEAALMLMTGKPYEYSTDKAMKQLADHFGGNVEQAEQEAADTLVLLAGKFSRTYCSLYSS
ncbi:hypothetical protein [Paenibacillus sp. KS-LC4]|uniref:hypothetical protein n=1 Tax=Paenibacillus sp. KS-LC4 TaxID=2979727 RepID=UPI0030CFA9F2